jgi:hypothetical protein
MQSLLWVTLLMGMAAAAPAPQAGAEGEAEECEGDHCFHGEHLWGLEEFHEERRKREVEEVAEDMPEVRRRRQAEDETPWCAEDQKCEVGTPHCFHGCHMWNLQPFHIE